ncbi:hypothetical protein ABZ864_33110 [Streptomyces sp. NPDC047082]|uniref:hypothetical protein n=1 Tax=Streptomyces sp. NPDC047082 TaxID=3155259 RepID=UPI00341148BE
MGRGEIHRDFGLAVPLCAAQIPSAALLAWIIDASGDDYGSGYGGAFGILCLLVFAPFLLPFPGLVQTVLLTGPALVAARRFGGPAGSGTWWAPWRPRPCGVRRRRCSGTGRRSPRSRA